MLLQRGRRGTMLLQLCLTTWEEEKIVSDDGEEHHTQSRTRGRRYFGSSKALPAQTPLKNSVTCLVSVCQGLSII